MGRQLGLNVVVRVPNDKSPSNDSELISEISCDDSVSATITISAEEKSGQSANMGSRMKMSLRLYMSVVRLVKMSILMARIWFNCEF